MKFKISEEQEDRAKRIHKDSIVIDATALIHTVTSERWFNQARSGGVDALWVTTGGSAGIAGTVRAASNVLRFIEKNKDVLAQVRTTEDIIKAKKEGKISVLFATQNAACLDGDFAYLSVMERLGYRVMGLTYSESNMLGDGCGERTREVRGLSYFGVDVVHEMNRLKILSLIHI